jgi:hypothetical protein
MRLLDGGRRLPPAGHWGTNHASLHSKTLPQNVFVLAEKEA